MKKMIWIEFPKPREDGPTRRILFMSRGAYKGGFEFNLIGRRYSLRIARHQVMFWRDHYCLLGWFPGEGLCGFWQPWNRPGHIIEEPS